MRALQLSQRLFGVLFADSISLQTVTLTSLSNSSLISDLLSPPGCHIAAITGNGCSDSHLSRSSPFGSPWSATQLRGVKVNAIHVKPGNVIEKTGRMYQVLDSEHKQRGRGGAMMQMELRDIDGGNKVSLRFGTEETVERVFVEEKSFTCLYTEGDHAFLIDPDTFEQMEVSLDLFGKAAAYLKDEMKVTLQLYDGRALSATIPKRVTCTITETQPPMKGVTATPSYSNMLETPPWMDVESRYKRALLDNGLTIQVPSYLETGEKININTEDDSYIGRA